MMAPPFDFGRWVQRRPGSLPAFSGTASIYQVAKLKKIRHLASAPRLVEAGGSLVMRPE